MNPIGAHDIPISEPFAYIADINVLKFLSVLSKHQKNKIIRLYTDNTDVARSVVGSNVAAIN